MNQIAPIGHNNPPDSTIYDAAVDRMGTLHVEASNWLDGAVAENQAQIDELSRLLAEARAAKKQADDARKEEAKPFDEGKAEVQARYKPLLTSADQIADGCKAAMAPFMQKLEEEKRAREEKARREAEEARRKADEAMRLANRANLAERESADTAAEAAAKAERIANAAARDKASGVGDGRAITMRTTYRAEIADLPLAARHYWPLAKAEFEAVVQRLAAADVRAGKREIPGITVIEEKKVQ